MSPNKIFVTRPSLPSMDELMPMFNEVWESRILTNGGKFHATLETDLCNYLGVKHISLFNNGTIALLAALKVLNLSGEVITTPFTFVATTHCLRFLNLSPVFVDIDPATFNIDPKKIEAAITENTTAILGVHCYGTPCQDDEIRKIAQKYNLRVIYDAAHAFGVTQNERSVFEYGDICATSFHATKVFNTLEGGAVITNSAELKLRIDNFKNFGISSETSIDQVGLNGKLSELNCCVGILQLKDIDRNIKSREVASKLYKKILRHIPGIEIPPDLFSVKHNHSYFPILINSSSSLSRDELYEFLLKENIFSRRYFYPLISNITEYSSLISSNKTNLAVANLISEQILCLPIYSDMDEETIIRICSAIKLGLTA
jgi:dTDP-4-amino-4,6-dideoxygalactose transaminase